MQDQDELENDYYKIGKRAKKNYNSVYQYPTFAFASGQHTAEVYDVSELPEQILRIKDPDSGCFSPDPNLRQFIKDYEYFEDESIVQIELKKGINSVGEGAFGDCKNLKTVRIESGTIEIIPRNCFRNCTQLTDIALHNSIYSIDDNAFDSCKSLNSIKLPNSLDFIGKEAFINCDKLEEISIPDTVTTISKKAFYNCTGLKRVELSKTLTRIGEYAFSMCSSIEELFIPKSVKAIDYKAFSNCTSLKKVIIEAPLYYLGNEAFSECINLEEVIILNGTKIIGNRAFYGCNSLRSVLLSGTVEQIEKESFCDCNSLKEVVIPRLLRSIGDRAFCNCTSLIKVIIEASLDYLGNEVFSGCLNLEEATILNGAKKIGNRAFYRCQSLHSIQLSGIVEQIEKECFFGCYSLKDVVLPDSLKQIGDRAFGNCVSLNVIHVPSSLMNIEFADCYLERIVFDGSMDEWINRTPHDWWQPANSYLNIECKDGTIQLVKGGQLNPIKLIAPEIDLHTSYIIIEDGQEIIKKTSNKADEVLTYYYDLIGRTYLHPGNLVLIRDDAWNRVVLAEKEKKYDPFHEEKTAFLDYVSKRFGVDRANELLDLIPVERLNRLVNNNFIESVEIYSDEDSFNEIDVIQRKNQDYVCFESVASLNNVFYINSSIEKKEYNLMAVDYSQGVIRCSHLVFSEDTWARGRINYNNSSTFKIKLSSSSRNSRLVSSAEKRTVISEFIKRLGKESFV